MTCLGLHLRDYALVLKLLRAFKELEVLKILRMVFAQTFKTHFYNYKIFNHPYTTSLINEIAIGLYRCITFYNKGLEKSGKQITNVDDMAALSFSKASSASLFQRNASFFNS